MKHKNQLLIVLLALLLLLSPKTNFAQVNPYPLTKKTDVEDNYHGTPVKDPYRWLELIEDSTTQTWVQSQNKYTKSYSKKLLGDDYYFDEIRKMGFARYYYHEKKIYPDKYKYEIFTQYEDLYTPAKLFYVDVNKRFPKLILDPRKLREFKGQIVSIDYWSRSTNEKFLVIDVSRSGSDWSELYIYDLEKGE